LGDAIIAFDWKLVSYAVDFHEKQLIKLIPWLLSLKTSELSSSPFSPNSYSPSPPTQVQAKPNISLNFSMGKIGVFDLEKHFAFYGAYHRNPINIAIHMLFVWPILFTALLILYFTPSLFNLPYIEFSLFGNDVILVLNVGFSFAFIYSVFYVCLDVKAGSLAALLCAICWVASSFIASRLGFSLAWKVQFWVFISFCS
jgi:hypothetical protein